MAHAAAGIRYAIRMCIYYSDINFKSLYIFYEHQLYSMYQYTMYTVCSINPLLTEKHVSGNLGN